MKTVVLFVLSFLLCYGESAKILAIFPMPGPSHYFLGNALTRALVEAGHDVTVISPFIEKNPPKNGKWRDILLSGFMEEKDETIGVNLFDLENMNPIMNLPFMNFIGHSISEKTLNHSAVQDLLKSNEKFDLLLLEQFNNDAMKGFAHHFNVPTVLLSTIGANAWVNPLVGNPSPPSYIPDIFLSYSSSMTFCERLKNSLFTLLSDLNRHWLFFPNQNKLLKQYFPTAPDLSVLNYNVSLVLLNSHVSTNQPKPHVPNMIEIGGYHVSPPKKLPKDLQEFLDSAKDGVIYFSMGSNLRSANMPLEKREAIVKALSKLKQKVLWKWEEDKLPGQPANIKLSKWLPQQDILAHPNVKLFITHGGLLSTTETIYHGVPVLNLPIFGDQKVNAAQATINGYGLSLPFGELTEEKMTNALNELLTNPQYSKNAQRRSKIMHDRPMKPRDTAVYWIEYVLRHKGAPHLRVAALDLNWYQYLLLDVYGLVLLVSVAVVLVLKVLLKKVCGKSAKKQTKIKKN